jgi:hypothetical protein
MSHSAKADQHVLIIGAGKYSRKFSDYLTLRLASLLTGMGRSNRLHCCPRPQKSTQHPTGLLPRRNIALLTHPQAGIPYSLYESESSASRPRTREWGMSIHWSRPLLEQLLPDELLARLREAAVDPSFDSSAEGGYVVPFYNGKTGEHIISMPMKNAIRVSRRKMRALCSEGLEIQVRW